MICVCDFPHGEVSVKVGVMEIGLNRTPLVMVLARYSEGPLFRKSIVQIRATMLTFGLRLRLVGIVDFRNSGPLE